MVVSADGGWKYLSTGAWTDDLDEVAERAKSHHLLLIGASVPAVSAHPDIGGQAGLAVVVAGCDGSWTGPGGAGSGYLVTSGGTHRADGRRARARSPTCSTRSIRRRSTP